MARKKVDWDGVDWKLSDEEICKMYDVRPDTVRKKRKEYSIPQDQRRESTTIRFPAIVQEALEYQAVLCKTSVSKLVRSVLAKFLKDHGITFMEDQFRLAEYVSNSNDKKNFDMFCDMLDNEKELRQIDTRKARSNERDLFSNNKDRFRNRVMSEYGTIERIPDKKTSGKETCNG